MRTAALNAALLVASVAVNFAGTRPVEPVAAAVADAHATAPVGDRIVAREVVLTDESGRPRITMRASKSISGIWIGEQLYGDPGENNKGLIALYESRENGAVIGYYGGVKRDFCDFAVHTQDGKTAIQIRGADGKPDFVPVASLKK